MNVEHYQGLYAAYAVAMIGWLIVLRIVPRLWPVPQSASFVHPLRELGYAFVAAIGIIVIGQLYTRGIRLPSTGPMGPLGEAVNQALIFSPVFLLIWIRRQPLSTLWLPTRTIPARVAIGLALALLALFVYSLVQPSAPGWFEVVGKTYQWEHVGYAVQVFGEDAAIAMLMYRLVAAVRRPWTAAVIVGFLFAAGHIPTMVSHGVALDEMLGLVFDFILGAGIVRILHRASDIWWFWCVHFAMDMTQFLGR